MELIMVGKLGINHKTHVALPSKPHMSVIPELRKQSMGSWRLLEISASQNYIVKNLPENRHLDLLQTGSQCYL